MSSPTVSVKMVRVTSPANAQSTIAQLDSVLAEYRTAERRADGEIPNDSADLHALLTRSVAAIERAAPAGSAYERDADDARKIAWAPDRLTALVGIIRALRADYVGGFMQRVEELIHAGVFDDFLEMADGLLKSGYKDPSAVIGGSVLEEHLRKLANRASVATMYQGKPVRADRLNAELVKAGVYGVLDQKSVTAWLDVRNKAAHGEYGNYDEGHVTLMLQGIRGFVARYPA